MTRRSLIIALVFAFGLIALAFVLLPLWKTGRPPDAQPVVADGSSVGARILSPSTHHFGRGLKERQNQFSPAERAAFQTNFVQKYKPAIERWNAAYKGHVPFSVSDVTPDRLAERVESSFVFVINGITLSVEDLGGTANVEYLNAPETKKMMSLPDGERPIMQIPVDRQELLAMVQSDLAQPINPAELRVTSSSVATALNGGAIVEVGGDPNNSVTWKANLVFNSSGQITYYLRGL